MAYQKLNENNETINVSEAEHLKEFMGSIPNVKKYADGKTPIDLVSLGGGTSFGMFNLVLGGKLLVPDSIRARVVAAMNYQLLRELEKVESNYEPKKRRFSVAIDVKRSGVHTVEVEAEDEREASVIVQKKIDSGELRCPYRSTEYLGTDIAEVKEVFDGR